MLYQIYFRTFVQNTSKSAVYTPVEQAVKYDLNTPETELCSDTNAVKQCITSIVPRHLSFQYKGNTLKPVLFLLVYQDNIQVE